MARATILLADNDPDFLATRGEFLKQEGYELVTAQSSASARRELGEGQINLAIIDIRLVLQRKITLLRKIEWLLMAHNGSKREPDLS